MCLLTTAFKDVDIERPDEGAIMPDYVVWINKAVRETKQYGLPSEYVDRYIRPYIPQTSKEEEERDILAIRVMSPRKVVPQTSR